MSERRRSDKTDSKAQEVAGMRYSIQFTNLGIQLSIGDDGAVPRKSTSVDQENPKGYYVYAHVDRAQNVFYIGKGTGKRAWSKKRHGLWTRYVERHLHNDYSIEILQDDLSEEDAEFWEAQWISRYGSQLVNWANSEREIDLAACELYWQRRNANKALLQQARLTESTDLEQAATMYIDVIGAILSYERIKMEKGLVGQLLLEEEQETGRFGEIEALDRLTICLLKLGRIREAARRVEEYFAIFKGDLNRAAADRIKKRTRKAMAKLAPE